MEIPDFIKVFNYMFELNKRNFRAYRRPIREPKREAIVENSVHWVGHATTIINLYDKIIITDPVVGNLGYIKRLVKPSIDLKSLSVDYVIITHGHMDHLNYNVLRQMNKDAVIIAPKGIRFILSLIGFEKIFNLENGEEYKDDVLKVQCIAAEHDGRRYWRFGYKESNSYVISCKDKSVLFTGDTAQTDKYKDINADIALMPVGCYKPDEYLTMHCSPEQSFKMFKMSKCKYMVPIHYKTYILAQDEDDETVKILNKMNDGTIKIIDVGETVEI